MSRKIKIFFLCLIIISSAVFFFKTLANLKKANLTSLFNNTYTKEDEETTLQNNVSTLKENLEKENFKNYLLGKFDHFKRNDFISLLSIYNISNNKIYLRKEANEAFIKMQKEALKDSVNLKIISGFRDFTYQKGIWENKWNGNVLVDGKNLKKSIPNELERVKKILEYSSMPGTSRHHWGTEIDINNLENSYFDSEKGKKEYNWLIENASKFGFCQPYNQKNETNSRTGYSEEKWHWSYFPISKELTNNYVSLIKEDDIKGFLGEQYIPEIKIITNYVLGINLDCL